MDDLYQGNIITHIFPSSVRWRSNVITILILIAEGVISLQSSVALLETQ